MPPSQGTPFQETRMLRLGEFVELCYFEGGPPNDPERRPFNNGRSKDPPLLHPRGVNRILIYPGCFNPPHRGHLELLKHVFLNAGDDLQITAAIVIPIDEKHLAHKTRSEKKALVLPREQRIELWQTSGIPKDRIWLFDRSQSDWAIFKGRLVECFRANSVEVKFMLLGGPDWVNTIRVPDAARWGCTDIITSDISRAVNFRYADHLSQLSSCTVWEKPHFDPERLRRQIQARMRGKPRQEIEKGFKTSSEKIKAAWVCRPRFRARGIVRFVPADISKKPLNAPSSTLVRQIITTCPPELLEKSLKGLAMGPNLLAQMVPKYLRHNEIWEDEGESTGDTEGSILW